MRRTFKSSSACEDLGEEGAGHLDSLQLIQKWWQQKPVYSETETHPGPIDQNCQVLS